MNKIIAYTDGSASTKGEKLGGYGIYIIDGDKEYFYRRGFFNTKTGRMEMMAIITCLTNIEDKTCRLSVYSDSEYVVKTISEGRLWRWKQTGFVGLANIDLLKRLFEEIERFEWRPKAFHIKGHTGLEDVHSLGNQIVDELANYKTQKSYERDLE